MSNIFREKSLKRIQSPEQLNDYVKVANPSVWAILIAVIVLLAGILFWSVFGRIESTVPVVGHCEQGIYTCYATAKQVTRLKVGMEVHLDGQHYEVESISSTPVLLDNVLSDYLQYLGDIDDRTWGYALTVFTQLPDGDYQAQVVTESISPISLVLN